MVSLNLGMRAHDLNATTPKELAEKLRYYGMKHLQLAVKKSFPDYAPSLQHITHGTASFLGETFQTAQLKISVLGCYVNISSENPSTRQQAVNDFIHHLTLAHDFNCTLVGTETGSVKTGYTEKNFTEEAYVTARTSVLNMMEAAEKLGVLVGIEAGINHPLYTWQLAKRLIKEVASPNLKIIFDPANLISLENYHQQITNTYDALEALQDKIAVIHLKDYRVEAKQIKIVPVGTGEMDYTEVLKFLKYQAPYLMASLEGVTETHLLTSRQFLEEKYANI